MFRNFICLALLIFPLYSFAEQGGNTQEKTWKIKEVKNLNAPFFNQEIFDLPENASESSQKIRLTAKCASNNVLPHLISRVFAWKTSDKKTNIFLIYESVEVNDHLLITIESGNVSAKYWTWPLVDGTRVSWNIKSLELATDSRLNIDSILKAKIHIELSGSDKQNGIYLNTIDGYLKPKVLAAVPEELSMYKF